MTLDDEKKEFTVLVVNLDPTSQDNNFSLAPSAESETKTDVIRIREGKGNESHQIAKDEIISNRENKHGHGQGRESADDTSMASSGGVEIEMGNGENETPSFNSKKEVIEKQPECTYDETKDAFDLKESMQFRAFTGRTHRFTTDCHLRPRCMILCGLAVCFLLSFAALGISIHVSAVRLCLCLLLSDLVIFNRDACCGTCLNFTKS